MTREGGNGRRGYWAVLLGRGVLAGLLALVVTFTPNHSPAMGLVVYGAFTLVQGLLLALTAGRSASTQGGGALSLAQGAVGIAAGGLALALLLVSIGAASAALVPAVAISAAVAGVLELLFGLRPADAGPDSRDHVVVGATTAALAAVVALVPADPIVTVGLLGAYGAIVGVYLVIAALSLRGTDRPGQATVDAEQVRNP